MEKLYYKGENRMKEGSMKKTGQFNEDDLDYELRDRMRAIKAKEKKEKKSVKEGLYDVHNERLYTKLLNKWSKK